MIVYGGSSAVKRWLFVCGGFSSIKQCLFVPVRLSAVKQRCPIGSSHWFAYFFNLDLNIPKDWVFISLGIVE